MGYEGLNITLLKGVSEGRHFVFSLGTCEFDRKFNVRPNSQVPKREVFYYYCTCGEKKFLNPSFTPFLDNPSPVTRNVFTR
jgi:hypothetical protein